MILIILLGTPFQLLSQYKMWNQEKIKEYWRTQTEKGDNPCHYHSRWQDKYAFRVRTKAFQKKDFSNVMKVVDIGCGVGDYTNALTKLTDADFAAYDFPFNIDIAKKKYSNNRKITFISRSLPDSDVRAAIAEADAVIMTTVYVHLAKKARGSFLDAAALMKNGGKVMILEYMPDVIPEYQRKLEYKDLGTPTEIIGKFVERGFSLKEMRHINFLDSFFFFHLGKSFISYYLTLFIESILHVLHFRRSKYKLLIFEKKA